MSRPAIEWSSFTRRVVAERARLAYQDPDGEAEAVAPLSMLRAHQIALALDALTTPSSRPPTAVRFGNRRDPVDFLHALGVVPNGRDRGVTQCPAHEDSQASLSWRIVDERLLLHCFAGCEFADIIARAAA